MNKYQFLKRINKFKDAIAIMVLLFVCYILYCLPSAVNATHVNIPAVITSAYGVLLMYFLGRKIASKKYGIISALILASSIEFVLSANYSSTDMLFAVCAVSSVFSGLYTLFCSYGHRRFFWWSAYIFAACAFVLNGFAGLLIPFLGILLSYIPSGKIKNLFNPLYFIPGILLFSAVLFLKHPVDLGFHIQLNYKFLPVFLLGFIPWVFSFAAQIFLFLKKSVKDTKMYIEKFSELQPIKQFMLVNTIFLFVVLFISFIFGGKSQTFILPAMFPASMIAGKFWFDYLFKDENERVLNISTLLLNFIFIAAAAFILLFCEFVVSMNTNIYIIAAVFMLLYAAINSVLIFKDKKLLHFLSLVAVVAVFSIYLMKFLILFDFAL